jgi:hypothetical protein
MKERKYTRYNMQGREEVKAYIQFHENADYSEIQLFDISNGGACLVIPRETFILKSKKYPIRVKIDNQDFRHEISAEAQKAWYLFKEFDGKEMMYLGVAFSKELNLDKFIA